MGGGAQSQSKSTAQTIKDLSSDCLVVAGVLGGMGLVNPYCAGAAAFLAAACGGMYLGARVGESRR